MCLSVDGAAAWRQRHHQLLSDNVLVHPALSVEGFFVRSNAPASCGAVCLNVRCELHDHCTHGRCLLVNAVFCTTPVHVRPGNFEASFAGSTQSSTRSPSCRSVPLTLLVCMHARPNKKPAILVMLTVFLYFSCVVTGDHAASHPGQTHSLSPCLLRLQSRENMKPAILAKLAAGVADLYGAAHAPLSAADSALNKHMKNTWSKELAIEMLAYRAASHKRQAVAFEEAGVDMDKGVQIAHFQSAKAKLEHAMKMGKELGKVYEGMTGLSDILQETQKLLDKAMSENGKIFFAKVRTFHWCGFFPDQTMTYSMQLRLCLSRHSCRTLKAYL